MTYHDGCSGLRELGVKEQPRRLLAAVGATVTEMAEPEICCGFGGTFCVKYPEISVRMVATRLRDIVATGADTVLAGDLGCLLNMAGALAGGQHRPGAPRRRSSRRDDRGRAADRARSVVKPPAVEGHARRTTQPPSAVNSRLAHSPCVALK